MPWRAERHPNIAGLKDSKATCPSGYFLAVPDLPSSDDGTFELGIPPRCSLGNTAIISAMANCAPHEIAEIQTS